ncbi:Transcription initiation factor TFIID subunit 8 [Plasmodiophora brassicae]|uniref:Transcription initiation factor TFIID subunit 8 n=1 Tax=Plasmodiophora brassicae TaxID=37360 RepID=A0A0G4IT05_PLABS|nr:hypothetical protein PBRA_006514 [Plasmodiophora brassicae]SPQ94484.1 unnamed protein product [Plasmodiophora brassicae]
MPSESAASVSQVMLAALRVACAELAIDVGYMRTHQSSLDTLSEIAARYIAEIAVNARSNAHLARRTHTNAWDIVNAVSDLGMPPERLLEYKKSSHDVPFVYDMLPTPQPRDVILCNRVGIEEREELPHDIALPNIPPCLPDLPPVHTFAYTPVYPNMSVDSKTRRKLIIKQKRQVESALVRLNRSIQKKDDKQSFADSSVDT